MYQNMLPPKAALISALAAIAAAAVGIGIQIFHQKYCAKHKDSDDKSVITKATILRIAVLAVFTLCGFFIGGLLDVWFTVCEATAHGMMPDPDTGKYNLTVGEMTALNKYSVEETDIEINDLKDKVIIYVRYDCTDCIVLHEQLASLDNVIFLSSRSKTGKEAREVYNINLTEIPQGVYIDPDGNSTVIKITEGSGDTLSLDMQQIAILQEMVKSQD